MLNSQISHHYSESSVSNFFHFFNVFVLYERFSCAPGDQRTTLVPSNWVFHQPGTFPNVLNQWPESSSNKPFSVTHFILVRIRGSCHCGLLFAGVLRIQMHILTFAQLSKKKTWEGTVTVCYKRHNWFIFSYFILLLVYLFFIMISLLPYSLWYQQQWMVQGMSQQY